MYLNVKPSIIFLTINILILGCTSKEKISFDPMAAELTDQASKLIGSMHLDSALCLLNRASRMDKDYYISYSNKVTIYCIKKNYEKALIECRMVNKYKPDLAEGWLYRGMLVEKVKKGRKAKKFYRKSIKLFAERMDAKESRNHYLINKFYRAIALLLLGDNEQGKRELWDLKDEENYVYLVTQLVNKERDEIMNAFIH